MPRLRRLLHPYITRFGNGELERIYAGYRQGHYTWNALAKGLQPLMPVNQIVNTGHKVAFEPTMVTITDLWNRYSLEIRRPRRRDGMWIVPFRVLTHLTRAKAWHAPQHAERLLQRAKDQFANEELI
jgi:hypothetical protein